MADCFRRFVVMYAWDNAEGEAARYDDPLIAERDIIELITNWTREAQPPEFTVMPIRTSNPELAALPTNQDDNMWMPR